MKRLASLILTFVLLTGLFSFVVSAEGTEKTIQYSLGIESTSFSVEDKGKLNSLLFNINLPEDIVLLSGQPYSIDTVIANELKTYILPTGTYNSVSKQYSSYILFDGWQDDNGGVMSDNPVNIVAKWKLYETPVTVKEVPVSWGDFTPETITVTGPMGVPGYRFISDTSSSLTSNSSIKVYSDTIPMLVVGHWVFIGWLDKNNGIYPAYGNPQTIEAQWIYVEVPKNKITYMWTDAPDSVSVPVDKTEYYVGERYNLNAKYTAGSVVVDYQYGIPVGKFVFSGWTDVNNNVMTENGNIVTGYWSYSTDISLSDITLPTEDYEEFGTILSDIITDTSDVEIPTIDIESLLDIGNDMLKDATNCVSVVKENMKNNSSKVAAVADNDDYDIPNTGSKSITIVFVVLGIAVAITVALLLLKKKEKEDEE